MLFGQCAGGFGGAHAHFTGAQRLTAAIRQTDDKAAVIIDSLRDSRKAAARAGKDDFPGPSSIERRRYSGRKLREERSSASGSSSASMAAARALRVTVGGSAPKTEPTMGRSSFRQMRIVPEINPIPDHNALDHPAFKVSNAFGQDAADFLSVEVQVVDPFDFSLHPRGFLERAAYRHTGGGGQQGDVGELIGAGTQQQTGVDAAPRRGVKAASEPAASGGLAVCNNRTAGQAGHSEAFRLKVGGIDLVKDPQVELCQAPEEASRKYPLR